MNLKEKSKFIVLLKYFLLFIFFPLAADFVISILLTVVFKVRLEHFQPGDFSQPLTNILSYGEFIIGSNRIYFLLKYPILFIASNISLVLLTISLIKTKVFVFNIDRGKSVQKNILKIIYTLAKVFGIKILFDLCRYYLHSLLLLITVPPETFADLRYYPLFFSSLAYDLIFPFIYPRSIFIFFNSFMAATIMLVTYLVYSLISKLLSKHKALS